MRGCKLAAGLYCTRAKIGIKSCRFVFIEWVAIDFIAGKLAILLLFSLLFIVIPTSLLNF